MNKNISLINELFGIAEFEKEHDVEKIHKQFGIMKESVLFQGLEKVALFEKNIDQLYSFDKEIANTYTLKTFTRKIVDLLRELNLRKQSCSSEDFTKLVSRLKGVPIVEYDVFNEIYGAEMNADIVTFGEFTVYNLSKTENLLIERYPHLTNRSYLNNIKSPLIIGIKVTAREASKAVEVTNRYYQSFENVMSFLISDLTHKRHIGLFNFEGHKVQTTIICTRESAGTSGHTLRSFNNVNIEAPEFKNPKYGFDKIWQLITKKEKTELENRISVSLDWIGKGVVDHDHPKALVQFVFAIEGLLQNQEGSFITPSIVSQISDSLAFIIGNDLNERKEIAKTFRHIYQKRSAIAHGGFRDLDLDDLQMALSIARNLIISLLTRKPYNTFTKIKQIADYFTELKYSVS